MANETNYKGYKYRVNVSAGAKGTYSPAVFLIYSDRGQLHSGKVEGAFSSPQDAFQAAHKAAREWIDKRAKQ